MQGYGLSNVEESTPATPQTVYHLASLTKQFMGTAIVLLAQDGKLALDDQISRYLDKTPAKWRGITIRQLLTYTSGIKDYLNEMGSATCNGTTPAEIISHLGEMSLNFAPGTAYAYSNTGYLVLDLIVQKVAGEPYDQFLAERIFRPLGITETRRNSLSEIIPYRASGYVWTDGKRRNSPFVEPTLYDNADDGLVSSVVDLARWDAALDTDSLCSSPPAGKSCTRPSISRTGQTAATV
jgi:D-alanyl-D-alanine carboxypeptidase